MSTRTETIQSMAAICAEGARLVRRLETMTQEGSAGPVGRDRRQVLHIFGEQLHALRQWMKEVDAYQDEHDGLLPDDLAQLLVHLGEHVLKARGVISLLQEQERLIA